jgi:hypothetical protein
MCRTVQPDSPLLVAAPPFRIPSCRTMASLAGQSERGPSDAESSFAHHRPLVLLFLIFRNPEFGHELETKSVGDSVAGGGAGTVIAAIV